VKAKMRRLSLAIAAKNQDRMTDRWNKEKLKFKV